MGTSDFVALFISQLWQLSALVLIVALFDRLLGRRWPQLVVLLWLAVFVKAHLPPIWTSSLGFFSLAEAGFIASQPIFNLTFPALLAAWLPLLWFVGVLMSFGCIARRWLTEMRRISQQSMRLDAATESKARSLAESLGIRCPRIVVCESQGPFVMGVFRTTLCLPRKLVAVSDWPALKPIILHELLHVRRGDALISLLQLSVSCLWWFNPLMIWASKRLTRAIEYSVDHEVTTAGCDARQYAKALLQVVDLRTQASPVFGAGMSPSWVTGLRIQRVLLSAPKRCNPLHRLAAWGIFFFCLAIFLPGKPVAMFGPKCSPSVTVTPQSP
jgi:beta-lactamase regulating signal transducer with metallopeptidase domain